MQLNETPRVVELKVNEDEDPESKSRGSHGVVLRGEGKKQRKSWGSAKGVMGRSKT
jgi:hypothetical protein